MTRNRVLNLTSCIAMTVSLLLGGIYPAAAQPSRLPLEGPEPAASSQPASPTDESKVPHYYGPWPNWATSPLTLPDAQVVITGNGSGAQAVASVGADGAVTLITVTNGGTGYGNAKVDIIGSGSGASAKATIVKKGAVVSITVDSFGAGYTAPTVSFSGGGSGGGAAATAYGRVDQVSVTEGGSGYTMPTVDFDLPDRPGGVQAQGHAQMDANGAITAVIVDSPGSGYSTAPGVAILNGTRFDPLALKSGGQFATATSSLSITAIAVTNSGADYKNAPSVTISDPTGSGASATAMIDNGVITSIEVTKPGSGYVTDGGIRKFVDTLPGLDEAGINDLGQYLPIAQPDTTTFPGTDYYVIALVQHIEQMHSDLPPTMQREYVQLSTSVVPGKQVPLSTDLLNGSTATLMPDGSQAYGVDDPHFLGPVIIAQKDRAVRITFYNLLPTGSDGNLYMPVDTTFMGAGMTDNVAELYYPSPTTGGSVMDDIRNPLCDAENKSPDNCYTDNRATLHLHGGITPWISDGTPRQWITPAGENTSYPEGVSVQNVPDMLGQFASAAGIPDCSSDDDGCSTFYYTNQQSARLMFYHDHAWGITRLNVYAGEAAGYIIRDDTEQSLIDAGLLPSGAQEIPLVLEDRTFVPDDTQLYDQYDANGNLISYGQDPTWDQSRWGGKGSLWYEHVYMPAQNPSDPSGMSGYGRWMYGPWFWPPATSTKYGPIDNPYYDPACNLDDPATWQYDTDPFCEPPLIPGTPNNSAGMEQFNDTPIVNGTVYPTTTVDPKAYRLRILNAANDRFWNLQWYVADPTSVNSDLNADGQIIGGTEVALKADELAAAQTDPNVFPTPDTNLSPVGPSWIQIGSEGGFLPAPVVIPNQPITWITDPTRFDFGNVDQHSLLLAPAERADAIVDFSKYAGQTLILYNDAPAAFPARISSYDYYTGGPDLSPVGAPTVLPGYGPNTRTIMQVKVRAASPAPAFDLSALNAAFRHHADGSGVFESGQHPIIVGQAAYNSAYGTNFASAAWCNSPSNPTAKCDGFARISEQGGDMFTFDTLSGDKVSIPLEPKAIHDEMNAATFDEFGRMTANLGLEAVPSNPGGQNINLMPYVFPPTEIFDASNLPKNQAVDPTAEDITITPITGIAMADGTQIWKITHNGVDTHPIHWHLYDLQVLDRVTWDNIIIPPDPNELGWKDTIRISPLEDTIVAIRPIIPWLPFEVPNSVRDIDPAMPEWNGIGGDVNTASLGDIGVLGSATLADTLGLGIPPSNGAGEPIDVLNHLVNFGWEYVLHCHILSHEEMDMMRPVVIAMPPKPPTGLSFDTGTNTLTWVDDSITETAFVVEKSSDGGASWTEVNTIQRLFSDPAKAVVLNPLPADSGDTLAFTDDNYQAGDEYRVTALNTVGDTWNYANAGNEIVSGGFPTVTAKSEYAYITNESLPPAAPSDLTATSIMPNQVDLGWTDNATNEDGFVIERRDFDGSVWSGWNQVGDTAAADVTDFSDTAVAPLSDYEYRVYAYNAGGNSAFSNVLPVTTPDVAPAAPTDLNATSITAAQVDLAWTAGSSNEAGFAIERSGDGGATWSQVGSVGAGTTAFNDTSVLPVSDYEYRVYAFNAGGNSAPSNSLTVTTPNAVPNAPTNLIETAVTSVQVDLAWTDNSNNEDGFVVERSDDGISWASVGSTGTDVAVFSDVSVAGDSTYLYRVFATNVQGDSLPSSEITVNTPIGIPPLAPSNPLITNPSLSSLTLGWLDNSSTETGFTVQVATDKNFTNNLQSVDVGADVTSYQFTLLAPNTKYYLRVRAFNGAGPSAWTAVISDKTLK